MAQSLHSEPINKVVAYSHDAKILMVAGCQMAVGKSGILKPNLWSRIYKKSPLTHKGGGVVLCPYLRKYYRYSRDTYSPYCSLDPIDNGVAEIPIHQV